MDTSHTAGESPRIPKNGLPLRCILLALCAVLLCVFSAGAAAPPRYEKAVQDMNRLEKSAKRVQREPWEKLSATFLSIYQTERKWKNRPSALYRSALALDRLARQASAKRDARRAVDRYLQLVRRYPRSSLADDSLYRAARLRGEILRDGAGAQALLRQQIKAYPLARATKDASRYLAALAPDAGKKDGRTSADAPYKGKPYRFGVRTVLIDPGHGGRDPGTHHNGIKEKTLTLDIAKRVGAILSAHGVRVRYTRTSDVRVSLEQRAEKVRTNRADLFISIHVNAHALKTIQGFETYYLDISRTSAATRLAAVENALRDRGAKGKMPPQRLFNIQKQESRRLARNVQETALKRLRKENYRTHDGGVKTAPFHVLRRSGVPGVLIEVGYCTNKPEAERLSRRDYRAAIARGIADGILTYTGKKP